jgi:hypothetical protein
MKNSLINTVGQLLKSYVILFIIFGLLGCSKSEPDKVAPGKAASDKVAPGKAAPGKVIPDRVVPDKVVQEGAEDEPVLQQMQRRIRPPFLRPLGPGDLFYDPGDIIIPPEEGGKPFPVKTVSIIDRTASSITLRWHDRSQVEDGTLLRRRRADPPMDTPMDSTAWEVVETYGPVSGFQDATDDNDGEGLDPDQRYCYQLIAFNEHGSSYSPQRCAYTKSVDENQPVTRVQLRVKTADISGAGTTGDKVRVRLNSVPGSLTVPAGNVTAMDYGRNDFEPGDDFTYDLELSRIYTFSDITTIDLIKDGSDGWCIEFLELWVNNSKVFSRDFSNTPDGCLTLDNDGGHSNRYIVSIEDLRAHPFWQWRAPLMESMDQVELESRIEGMIGNFLSNIDEVTWGDRNGRAWVEATYVNSETIHISLDLEAEEYGLASPVYLDFYATFRFTKEFIRDYETDEIKTNWKFDVAVSNLEVTADFDWFTHVLSYLLPCGPISGTIISHVSGEICDDCITCLEKFIENNIREGFVSESVQLPITNDCNSRGGSGPTVTVTEVRDLEDSENLHTGIPLIEFDCVAYATAEITSPLDGIQKSWNKYIVFTTVLEDFFSPELEDFLNRDTYKRSITLTSNREEDGEICTVEGDSNELNCTGRLKTLGQHTVRLDASDEAGTGFKPDSVSIEIVNGPPSVTHINPENGLIRFSDQYVSFYAQVFDPDGEKFFQDCQGSVGSGCVTWLSDGLDITPGTGNASSFMRTLSPGVHEITCTARDGKGEESSASTTVTVLDELSGKPSAHIQGISNSILDETQVAMQGRGLDSQDFPDDLRYEWFSDVDGDLLVEGQAVEVTLSNDAGFTQHIITLRVTDMDGNWDEVSVPFMLKKVLHLIINN